MPPLAVTFRDANFPERLAWCWSELEGESRRWIPYGMPRLNPDFESAVFFLIAEDGKTPIGSGVLVALFAYGTAIHCYAVTALHATRDAYSLRLNTRDGKSRHIAVDPDEWSALYGIEDLAALDITERLQATDKVAHVPFSMFADRDFISSVKLGIGEDGFMLGLFTGHKGESKNRVAARFGNISLLADDSEPIQQTESRITSPCHVFDMHSRPGFSGSPVFVYRTPDGDLRDVEHRALNFRAALQDRERRDYLRDEPAVKIIDMTDQSNRFLRLLGIHVAQFLEKVQVRKVPKKKARKESDETIKHGDEIRFPSSMTIIVPAWQITKLIQEDPKLTRQREVRDRVARAEMDAQAAIVASELAAADAAEKEKRANPNHKRDFTALVGAAAKKKPQAD